MNLYLDYEGFEEYFVSRNEMMFRATPFIGEKPGVRYQFKFPNRYGASVIKHVGSYGYYEDKWELAVIHYDDNDRDIIVYDTGITDDVIGYLSDNEVRELLGKIKEL